MHLKKVLLPFFLHPRGVFIAPVSPQKKEVWKGKKEREKSLKVSLQIGKQMSFSHTLVMPKFISKFYTLLLSIYYEYIIITLFIPKHCLVSF